MPLVIIIVSGMLLIVLAADYFTNGIEWLGTRLGISEGALGSLLAAVGTALPETLVPVMAFAFGLGRGGEGIGLGAILGAPFMLATVGFMVVGLGLWMVGRQKTGIHGNLGPLTRDLRFFLAAFGLALVAAFLPHSWHRALGILLMVLYCGHAWGILHRTGAEGARAGTPSSSLRLYAGTSPPLAAVVLQVGLALAGLVIGAHFFVVGLNGVSADLHWSGFLLSVLVTPLATELPEVLNSVIWLRRSRDQLALGNISGAMAFQASIVPAVGLFFSAWRFNGWELATAVIGWMAAAWVLVQARRGMLSFASLMWAGGVYFGFFVVILLQM